MAKKCSVSNTHTCNTVRNNIVYIHMFTFWHPYRSYALLQSPLLLSPFNIQFIICFSTALFPKSYRTLFPCILPTSFFLRIATPSYFIFFPRTSFSQVCRVFFHSENSFSRGFSLQTTFVNKWRHILSYIGVEWCCFTHWGIHKWGGKTISILSTQWRATDWVRAKSFAFESKLLPG